MAGWTNYIIYFQKIVIFLYKPDEDLSGIDQSKYCKYVVWSVLAVVFLNIIYTFCTIILNFFFSFP